MTPKQDVGSPKTLAGLTAGQNSTLTQLMIRSISSIPSAMTPFPSIRLHLRHQQPQAASQVLLLPWNNTPRGTQDQVLIIRKFLWGQRQRISFLRKVGTV